MIQRFREVGPGDTITIVVDKLQRTKHGTFPLQGVVAVTYEQLVSAFTNMAGSSTAASRPVSRVTGSQSANQPGKDGKVTRHSSPATRFSRIVALNVHAIKHGKWTNGTRALKGEALKNLVEQFKGLPAGEYKDVSTKAWESLRDLKTNPDNYGLGEQDLGKLNPLFVSLRVT